MKKQILIVGINLIIIIGILSGCTTSDGVAAEGIIENFIKAVDEVDSYKYSGSGTTTQITTNDTSTSTEEQTYTIVAEVDISNKEYKVETDISYTLEGIPGELSIPYYYVNDTLYTGMNYSGNMTWMSWGSSNNWYAYSLLERQLLFISSGVEFERLDDAVVQGTDCYVVDVKPDVGNLQLTSSNTDFLFPTGISDENFIEVIIKYWINKDTKLLKRAYIKSSYNVTSSLIVEDGNEQIYTHETDLLFYDYNVPVSVELPPEALEDNWWDDWGEPDVTPVIVFTKVDTSNENTLTVIRADPVTSNWGDIELRINDTANEHGLTGLVADGDMLNLTSIAGTGAYNVSFWYIPTDAIIVKFEFVG